MKRSYLRTIDNGMDSSVQIMPIKKEMNGLALKLNWKDIFTTLNSKKTKTQTSQTMRKVGSIDIAQCKTERSPTGKGRKRFIIRRSLSKSIKKRKKPCTSLSDIYNKLSKRKSSVEDNRKLLYIKMERFLPEISGLTAFNNYMKKIRKTLFYSNFNDFHKMRKKNDFNKKQVVFVRSKSIDNMKNKLTHYLTIAVPDEIYYYRHIQGLFKQQFQIKNNRYNIEYIKEIDDRINRKFKLKNKKESLKAALKSKTSNVTSISRETVLFNAITTNKVEDKDNARRIDTEIKTGNMNDNVFGSYLHIIPNSILRKSNMKSFCQQSKRKSKLYEQHSVYNKEFIDRTETTRLKSVDTFYDSSTINKARPIDNLIKVKSIEKYRNSTLKLTQRLPTKQIATNRSKESFALPDSHYIRNSLVKQKDSEKSKKSIHLYISSRIMKTKDESNFKQKDRLLNSIKSTKQLKNFIFNFTNPQNKPKPTLEQKIRKKILNNKENEQFQKRIRSLLNKKMISTFARKKEKLV